MRRPMSGHTESDRECDGQAEAEHGESGQAGDGPMQEQCTAQPDRGRQCGATEQHHRADPGTQVIAGEAAERHRGQERHQAARREGVLGTEVVQVHRRPVVGAALGHGHAERHRSQREQPTSRGRLIGGRPHGIGVGVVSDQPP
ncbi:hypothetical protein GCM10009780_29690 [Actinomadura alba]